MTEKTISISGLTSVDVYGVNDRKLDRMRHFFPDVRIVARGTEIRLEGPDDNVERLALRIETMLNALSKGEEISDSDLERMLDWQTYPSELEEREPAHNEEYYNIVAASSRPAPATSAGWWTNTIRTTLSSPSARQALARHTRPSHWPSEP